MQKVSIGRKTVCLARQLIKLRNKCLRDFDCQVSEAHVHAFIYFVHNSGCTEKQAALAIEKDKTNIAKAVKKLIEQGLIISKTDESDARYKRIWPTQKGEEQMQKVKKALEKTSIVMSKNIEQTQIDVYLEILEKMRSNIQFELESR